MAAHRSSQLPLQLAAPMKVSELSLKSGVSLSTIKYYIREGLLAPGERTCRNQATYHGRHLERLSLIRALREQAGLPVEAIARALRAADEAQTRAQSDFVVAAIDAIERPSGIAVAQTTAEYRHALKQLLELAATLEWTVRTTDNSLQDAARALTVALRVFPKASAQELLVYGHAVQAIARQEVPDTWAPTATPDSALRYAVLGTVVIEPLILALRRMAHVARMRTLTGESRSKRDKARTPAQGKSRTRKATTSASPARAGTKPQRKVASRKQTATRLEATPGHRAPRKRKQSRASRSHKKSH